MRRRLLLLSTLVVLPFALAAAIETAALAGNTVSHSQESALDVIVVSKSGDGSGTVTSVRAGIDCGKICSHSYPHYHAATLIATPAAGSSFGGWSVSYLRRDRGVVVISGACPGTGKCHVYASRNHSVVVHATFIGHCVVPKVKGKTLTAAKRSINSHGCIVGKITHAASRTVKKGNVLWQTPKQGKWLTKWTQVNLGVSSG